MNRKMINIVVAVAFFVVGVTAATNTLRLNNYMDKSLQRDVAQERCQIETLKVLTVWAKVDRDRISSLRERNDGLRPVIQAIVSRSTGGWIPAEAGQGAMEAINHSDDELNASERILKDNPLPNCDLGSH